MSWSDEAERKMTTRVTVWGTGGRITADRQECRAYLRAGAQVPEGYEPGWNVRYTTELTDPVWFYLRGEEYSAQIDAFVQRVRDGRVDGENGFDSAAVTDRAIAMLLADANQEQPLRRRDPRGARRAGAAAPTLPARAREREGRVMDRLLLGDNQFFGVNHMSEEKARAQSMRFQRIEAIIDVLDGAYDEGVRTFMCTTHDRMQLVCEHVRANPERYADFRFYPGMPYAHKYANAVTEHGMLGALRRFLPDEGLFDAARRGGSSMARKDLEGVTTLLIDAEMKMFGGLATPVVFLQNVVVDLLLGLGIRDAFRIFAEHVRDRYGAEPGFFTMNLPALVPVLAEAGVENPIVCASLNKLGFRMCGGLDAYEAVLHEHRFRAVAMSIFASGAIPPREAIEWVCAQPNVESIVFGASSRANIASTRDLVAEYWPAQEAAAAAATEAQSTPGASIPSSM